MNDCCSCFTHKRTLHLIKCLCLVGSLIAMHSAYAIDFNFSGFGSIVAGYSSGSCTPQNTMSDNFNSACTRFVADWAHAGVYSDAVDYRQESKLGVQGTLKFSPSISLT